MSARDDDLADLKETFFEEAHERLAELEGLFLQLEGAEYGPELLDAIFREVHSLKGGAAACKLRDLVAFAHAFENLLSQLRQNKLHVGRALLALMLESVDALDALLRAASDREPQLTEECITQIRERIEAELTLAGLSVPPTPSTDSGLGGLVLFDEEPDSVAEQAGPEDLGAPAFERPAHASVPAQSHAPQAAAKPSSAPASAPFASSLPASEETPVSGAFVETTSDSEAGSRVLAAADDADEGEDALVDAEQLARLVDLSVELVVASSALSHALADGSRYSPDRIQELFSDAQTHTAEIESRLASARSHSSSAIADVVQVRVGARSYFLPLACVQVYFSLEPEAVRDLPGLGQVVGYQGCTLRLVRLDHQLGMPSSGSTQVALMLREDLGKVALVVDEVCDQNRVVIRPLAEAFAEAGCLLGAALLGSEVILVLDPGRLVRKPATQAKAPFSGLSAGTA